MEFYTFLKNFDNNIRHRIINKQQLKNKIINYNKKQMLLYYYIILNTLLFGEMSFVRIDMLICNKLEPIIYDSQF